MKTSDKQDYCKVMLTLGTIYGTELDDAVLELYWRNLIDYDIQEIKRAVDLHIKNPTQGRFMPKPADLIGYLSGDSGDHAIMAWEAILEALRLGRLNTEFSTGKPAGDRALRAIGIGNIKMGREVDQHFLAKRFREYYTAFDKDHYRSVLKVDFQNKKLRIAKND